MTVTYTRRLELAGSFNFRDLGGYETSDGKTLRWRKLFRADALHRLTPEDINQLRDIGLTTVIDLRSNGELETDGIGSLFDHNVRHRHVPFHANPTPRSEEEMRVDLFTLYQRMLEQAQPCVQEVFLTLAETDNYPAVFHCAAGKDRTGMIGGLLLSALGVPESEIIADYALTETYMADRLEAMRNSPEFKERYANIDPSWMRAEPTTMANTLAFIKTGHGSVQEFLASCDVTTDQIDAIRNNLLD